MSESEMSMVEKKKIIKKFLNGLDKNVISLMVKHLHHLNPVIVDEQVGLRNLRSLILDAIALGAKVGHDFESRGIKLEDIVAMEENKNG